MTSSRRRLPYWHYAKKQLRFGWWWIPAVITGAWIQYRSGGLYRFAFLVPFAVVVTLVAVWWEWRKSNEHQ